MRAVRTVLAGAAVLAGTLGASLPAASGSTTRASGRGASGQTIVIGSANYTEQDVVAYLYADVLEGAGFKVRVRPDLGARQEVVPALEKGALDVEPDYAGTLLLYLDKKAGKAANSLKSAVPALKRELAPSKATVLAPAPAIDTNVFAVSAATDRKYHLGSHPELSQLKPYASKLVLGGPSECPENATCEPGLEKVYGLHFKSFQSTDEAGPITVAALKGGTVQVAEFFSSDPLIQKNGFVVLKDDKHLQAADNLIPVVRKSVDTSKLSKALDRLSSRLTTSALSGMNEKVNQHENPETVAKAWVKQSGLG